MVDLSYGNESRRTIIRSILNADAWPVDLQRRIYRRQAQLLLLIALPLLLWQVYELAVGAQWWLAMALALAALVFCPSRQMHRLIPLAMCVYLGLQVALRLHTGAGLDAVAACCLLLMVLVALPAGVVFSGLLLFGWAVLLILSLWRPESVWQDVLAANLPLFGVALMLSAISALIRHTLVDLQRHNALQTNQLQQSTLNLNECHKQNRGLLQRLEERVEQRTAQLQLANRELVEANVQLEGFNYLVSHDMRASLRVMDGFAKVLLDDLGHHASAAVRQDLDRIQTAIRHMHGMVVQLLKLSKAGNTQLSRRTTDLSSMARELLNELHMVEPQRDVEVAIAEGVQVEAEPVLMREVLQNLLANAWKFTALRNNALIEFGTCEGAQGTTYYVRDNGVGFDMQRVSELFKPFSRLHAAQGFEGTGVGLVAVKRIVERHGGQVWAVGAPNRGAKLCFTLGEAADVASIASAG
ncbi:MAG: ATP-binding protein [Steroidobacteraceae bacterium]